METNFNPVVAVVANSIVFDNNFSGAIQVNGVIAVAFEDITTANTSAGFVINSIAVVDKAVVEDMELGRGTDAVVAVSDGEANDLGFWPD